MEPVECPPAPRRGRIPRGLLGMVVIVAAIEGLHVRGNPDLANPNGAIWRHTARRLAEVTRGRDILCFGDSMVRLGLLGRTLREETGRPAANLALLGGSAPSSYFLLRRSLESGARPSTVIVDFQADLLRFEPASDQNRYPWADLIDSRESLELGLAARDPELFGRITLARLLPSYKARFEIRASVQAAFRGERTAEGQVARQLCRNFDRNRGDMAFGKVPFQDLPAPGPAPATPAVGTWRPDPTNVAFLNRFLDLAERHRIRVVWLLPPCSPGQQARRDASGDESLYDAFVRSTLRRHSGVVVLDARRSGYAATVFHDHGHLDRDGAQALSFAVAGFLKDGPPAPASATRWVPLAAYRRPDRETPLVDLDQMWAARDEPPAGTVRR